MQRILVTGATGFIGYEVSRQLAMMGLRPRLMVRRPERGALLAPLRADLVCGDLTSPASLSRAVQGIDAIIHLGARATFEAYTRLRPTIVQGSSALMQAACEAGVQSFVFASSLFVYDRQSAPITAQTPAVPQLGYGRAKLEAEGRLQEQAEHASIPLAIVRLPHVYGAQDLLFAQVRRGYVLFPGQGHNLFAHLHVTDAARVLIAAALQCWSGVSAVADDRPACWNEFFSVLQAHYPRFRTLRLPAWMARFGTSALQPLLRLQSRPSLLTPDTIRGWNLHLPVTPRLLWNDLALKPCYASIDSGIPAVLDDCIAFRWRHPLADSVRY